MFDALLLYQWRTPQPELYRNLEEVIDTLATLNVPLLWNEGLKNN